MPSYKITYFDARGLAEPARQLFSYAKVPFEDVRIPIDQAPLSDEKKGELGLPWGSVPLLEIDGKKFGQSVSFTRYLAKEFKLAGKDGFEEYKADEYVEGIRDFMQKWIPLFTLLRQNPTDETKKAELMKNLVEVESPKDLGRFNKILEQSSSGWLIGQSLTYADIYVATIVNNLELALKVKLTTGLPAVAKLVEKVHNAPGIQEWIAKRPATPF